MKFRRLLSLALVLLLASALPIRAMAEEYDLNVGSVTVTADESGQYVWQANNADTHVNEGKGRQETTATVITSKPSESCPVKAENDNHSNTITVNSTGENVRAEITIKDVTIEAGRGSSAIEVGNSKAEITVEGDNTVKTTDDYSAAIHVSGGNLTIEGDAGAKLSAQSSGYFGAAIGTGNRETMSGSITIQGSARVDADSGMCGAAIGSCDGGDMSGSIIIQGNAQVYADSGFHGAAIGAGYGGAMNGSITIQGNAQVDADSGLYGAAIGSGFPGIMSGSITIQGNAQVEATSVLGTAIGAGSSRGGASRFEEKGVIAIKDTADVAVERTDVSSRQNPIGAPDISYSKGRFEIDSTAKLNGENITEADQLRGYGLQPNQVTIGTGPEPAPEPEPIPEPVPAPTPAPTPDPEPVPASLYWVLNGDGQWAASQAAREGGVLTVTVEEENASFAANREGLAALAGQGVETVVFVTSAKTSSFDVAEALAAFASGKLILTHTGGEAELTLDGVAHNELLK